MLISVSLWSASTASVQNYWHWHSKSYSAWTVMWPVCVCSHACVSLYVHVCVFTAYCHCENVTLDLGSESRNASSQLPKRSNATFYWRTCLSVLCLVLLIATFEKAAMLTQHTHTQLTDIDVQGLMMLKRDFMCKYSKSIMTDSMAQSLKVYFSNLLQYSLYLMLWMC